MGLSDEDRKSVVDYQLEKAKRTLAEIPILLENKFWRNATNRLYYACFYAATALLINDGHETHTHNGVQTLLGLHFVNKGIISAEQGRLFRTLFERRLKGDYDALDIKEEDIKPLFEPAKEFIAEIENLLS